MRSPAAAIAWEFRTRHHWGLRALAACLVVMAGVKVTILVSGRAVTIDSAVAFALVDVVPLTAIFFYFLAMFSYGLAGDIAARPSMFPTRLYALPVTTAALAGWPMLYGTAAMALLWGVARLLAVWPTEFDIPMVWPGLLAASLLAWLQALTWMPYPLAGMRVIVTMLCLTLLDVIVFTALEYQVPEHVMLMILAPNIPLAYVVARFAVARGRRGDVPDWRGLPARLALLTGLRARPRHHFRSPARAHAWFEWRRHGRSLPALVALLLPFELGMLFLIGETPALVFYTLAAVLLTPAFMAGFVAATVSRPNPQGRDAYGLSPFIATRPVPTAALIAAPLTTTIRSTLAAWALVLVAIPLALWLSDTAPTVVERARRFAEAVGAPRATVVAVLGLAALISWTWKRLVQSLFIGLTGREWLIKGNVFFTLSLLCAVGPAIYGIGERAVVAAVWNWLITIMAVLVFLKMAAVTWIAIRLHDSQLVSDRSLLAGAACWCGTVFALWSLLVWLVDSPLFPRYFFGLIAILAIPLARLAAAPLALAWNRHR
jgi:hypothetical protein